MCFAFLQRNSALLLFYGSFLVSTSCCENSRDPRALSASINTEQYSILLKSFKITLLHSNGDWRPNILVTIFAFCYRNQSCINKAQWMRKTKWWKRDVRILNNTKQWFAVSTLLLFSKQIVRVAVPCVWMLCSWNFEESYYIYPQGYESVADL